MGIVHLPQCGDPIITVDSIMAGIITTIGDWFYNKG
jgi:hypothetical protein